MIRVSAFQPFESRRGIDTVLALQFRYDAELNEVIKSALREASRDKGIKNAGGWLAEHRCWFVEREAWPSVREHLRAGRYSYSTSPEVDEPPCCYLPRTSCGIRRSGRPRGVVRPSLGAALDLPNQPPVQV
jgi:hypothetical protein